MLEGFVIYETGAHVRTHAPSHARNQDPGSKLPSELTLLGKVLSKEVDPEVVNSGWQATHPG